MNILVSGCLMGCCCRYDGKAAELWGIDCLLKDHVLIPVCPEQMGGLATPRHPAERVKDRVITCNGQDVTGPYTLGAQEALKVAKRTGCGAALLKDKSPSCGTKVVYDGTFCGRTIKGQGITTQVLAEAGIPTFGELEELIAWLTK